MDYKQITGRVDYARDSLWGESGGQLEYVSQTTEWRKMGNRIVPFMIITFTDHDVQVTREGDDRFYKLEFPIFF